MKYLDDVKELSFKGFTEKDGCLIPLESKKIIPFDIKRVFYVYSVKDNIIRGMHSHRTTEQVLICLSGFITVLCKDEKNTRGYLLDNPSKGLYVPNEIWDEQVFHSKDSILLVLANTLYDKKDYIEDWKQFIKWRKS